MHRLKEVLQDILQNETIYLVQQESENWFGSKEFVLAPVCIGSQVLGLVDVEYGWPQNVPIETITTIHDLCPSHRKHPFITSGSQTIAAGIQTNEYWEIMKKKG
jgi:hypothetical protein